MTEVQIFNLSSLLKLIMHWFYTVLYFCPLILGLTFSLHLVDDNICLPVTANFSIWRRGQRSDVCPVMKQFRNWRLTNYSLLIDEFPIDPERRNFVREVKNAIFSFVDPTPLQTIPELVALSEDALTNILDLEPSDCQTSTEFLDFVSGNRVLKGSIPKAHRYGGHQFGWWASQLGDGRAHSLGEYVNRGGERWELQLKGSGKTPYSRRGDGRAVLRSSIREFLCSEAFHHLGIPTSRAASLIVSDDPVIRDQFYNGNIKKERAAVVLRLSPSWFRIGSLEILESNSENELLRHLVDFIIVNYFQNEVDASSDGKYVDFYRAVVNRTILTVARWMSVGFAHGVCNTDNFSLLGLTIDYGPFGFVEEYDPDFVPNTSDDEGRYSLEKQPSVAKFNLQKLKIALSPIVDKKGRKKMKKILQKFDKRYENRINYEFSKKLGFFNNRDNDVTVIASLLYMMQQTKSDFTMTFRELSELPVKNLENGSIPDSFWALKDLAKHEYFSSWIKSYRSRLLNNPKHVTDERRLLKMQSVNPRYVLKNCIAERAIQMANENDFSEVQKIFQILHNPFVRQKEAEDAGFASRRPNWADNIKVSCSS